MAQAARSFCQPRPIRRLARWPSLGEPWSRHSAAPARAPRHPRSPARCPADGGGDSAGMEFGRKCSRGEEVQPEACGACRCAERAGTAVQLQRGCASVVQLHDRHELHTSSCTLAAAAPRVWCRHAGVQACRRAGVQACGCGGACSSSSCSDGRRASSSCSSRPSAGCSRALRSSESSASAGCAMRPGGVAATSRSAEWRRGGNGRDRRAT